MAVAVVTVIVVVVVVVVGVCVGATVVGRNEGAAEGGLLGDDVIETVGEVGVVGKEVGLEVLVGISSLSPLPVDMSGKNILSGIPAI